LIDKQSPVPIYFQIEEQIKQQIESGELKQEGVIPSEREYTEKYKISRMTVRQAINNLVNDGYLYREKGKGTFVARKKIEQPLVGLTSFTEDMKSRGMKPGSKLISFDVIPAGASIAQSLKINEDDLVYEIFRVRLADNVPMALETNYISSNLIQGLTRDIVDRSLYDYIENTLRLNIGHAMQTVESSLVRENEREFLGIQKNAPILLIQRQTFLEDGTPLEFVKSSYRADRYKFVIQMNRVK
jgi:GntR family transcriptional regulator